MQNNSDYFNKLVSCYLAAKILKKKLNCFYLFSYIGQSLHILLEFFLREFQFIAFAFDDNHLSLDQDTNQFLMYIISKKYKHPF